MERLFSRGRLLLSHVRSRLSPQTIRALLCLGLWSQMDLVKSEDLHAVCKLDEVEGEDEDLEDGWDTLDMA